jgi:linoleoyl-CoA desaturase
MPPNTSVSSLARNNFVYADGQDGAFKVPAKVFSYAEILAHSGQGGSSYTIINKVVYDMSDFINDNVHPGGVLARLAAGRDSTRLLYSYHPLESAPKVNNWIKAKLKPLGRFEGKTPDDDLVDTNKLESPKFLDTLRTRVDAHLQEKGLSRHTEVLGITEALMTLIVFFVSVYWKAQGSLLAALLTGFAFARMGFLMHMGCHGALSKYPLVNRLVGHLMDLGGASSVNWSFDHQIGHHLDPNVYSTDNDAKVGNPFVRLHTDTPRRWWHKTQHWHLFPLMCGGFFNWFASDFSNFKNGSVGSSTFFATSADWALLLCFKSLFLLLHIVYPWVSGVAGSTITVQVCIFMMLGAFYLENTFIVNHIQKGLIPPERCHWGVRQVLGSCNWRSGSLLYNFISGGLNHQIEHHLFPSLSHYHYPEISPIVQETCKEFGIKYRNHPTWYGAFDAMRDYLYELGRFDVLKED